jgi:hypothetical protein
MSIKNRQGDTRHYFKTYRIFFYLFFYNKIIKESTFSRQLNNKREVSWCMDGAHGHAYANLIP